MKRTNFGIGTHTSDVILWILIVGVAIGFCKAWHWVWGLVGR